MIEAKIVADSLAPSGVRLTTFVLTYPRFIHAEFMTHRVFSRNASSSRAIPVQKQIQMVLDNPVIPIAFTKNQKGMQGGEALTGVAERDARYAWETAAGYAVKYAQLLSDLEVHKQYANRILEPFSHITVVCTATDYANFFALRCHEAAQPEIRVLADTMYEEYQKSEPKQLEAGQWHLPFITAEDRQKQYNKIANKYVFPEQVSLQERSQELIKSSVARCARVSYLNHEGKTPTLEEDSILYDRLLGNIPIHASPAEHQAMAVPDASVRSGNFRGWIQYRQTLKDQNVIDFKK